MKKNDFINNQRIKSVLASFLILLLFTSCGQSSQKQGPQQQSGSEEQRYDKAPQKLKAIEANIEKIFQALEGPAVVMEEGNNKQGSQQKQSEPSQTEQQSSQGGSQGGGQGKDASQSQGQQPQGGQQKETQPSQPQKKDPWKDIDPIINNLHYQWNDYMPEAVKKGADFKITDNFSRALNILTDSVKGKNTKKTLKDANNLYNSVFDLYSLYRLKMSPEIKRMRFLIRDSVLEAVAGNWEIAGKDVQNLKSSWSIFKNTLDKELQTDSGKLDFSIVELERVVSEKNPTLTDIKGRVALSNIQSIEKYYEKKSD